jgi:UDP:flavonoid glycosyltransferase YjiC (YdhE family)
MLADGDPLILVTASTDYQNDRRLVDTTLETFRDQPVRVLATTGAHDPTSFATPPNAVITRTVSHRRALERAACVVCHGGMGITQKALAAAVPVCAVPFGRDQHEVARRVELSGGGVRLPARRLDPRRLRTGVERTIALRDGAARIASAFAAIDGPTLAADALDRVIRP